VNRTLTIDTFAWIEQIRGTPVGAEVRRLIERSDDCLTPAIVLAEVAHRCFQFGFDERRVQRELRDMAEASDIVGIDPELAISGSRAATELRERAREKHLPLPGLPDGLVLATARRFGSGLVTGDRHLQGLPETLWLG
jgi:predicted nucleic acid-binding protein